LNDGVARFKREVGALSNYQDMLIVEFKKTNLKAIQEALRAMYLKNLQAVNESMLEDYNDPNQLN
jgi:hypothetical protein